MQSRHSKHDHSPRNKNRYPALSPLLRRTTADYRSPKTIEHTRSDMLWLRAQHFWSPSIFTPFPPFDFCSIPWPKCPQSQITKNWQKPVFQLMKDWLSSNRMFYSITISKKPKHGLLTSLSIRTTDRRFYWGPLSTAVFTLRNRRSPLEISAKICKDLISKDPKAGSKGPKLYYTSSVRSQIKKSLTKHSSFEINRKTRWFSPRHRVVACLTPDLNVRPKGQYSER